MGTAEAIDGTCKTPGLCPSHVGEYRLPCSCGNCGWRGEIRLSRGHQRPSVSKPECPSCGCRTVYVSPRGAWSM